MINIKPCLPSFSLGNSLILSKFYKNRNQMIEIKQSVHCKSRERDLSQDRLKRGVTDSLIIYNIDAL